MEKTYAIGFGSSFLLAIVFLILSGALYDTYWGLFVLIPYLCIPLMGTLCPAIAGESDSSSAWNQFGYFLESFFWVSSFGIPSVLLHVDAINGSQFAWVFAANILVLVSYIGFAKVSSGY